MLVLTGTSRIRKQHGAMRAIWNAAVDSAVSAYLLIPFLVTSITIMEGLFGSW